MDLAYYKAIEQQYEQQSFSTDKEFQLIAGTIPILVSAPHSVTHFREGKQKIGEFMTAALAIRLHELTGCSYITKMHNNGTDPNFDTWHPYKDTIVHYVQTQHVQVVLDLHIMSSKREANIEIGTGKGKNLFGQTRLVQELLDAFKDQALQPIIVDELFTGGNPNTVSSTVARQCGIPVIQLEINWRLLDTSSPSQQIDRIVNALQQFIESNKKPARA